ncbi:response regulator [Rubellicoccus peritrichatus]|uniref:Response regulator n=1 Tax=Rubellicoccus peritrichatus TaxID=3080537 RepID=A0AAQ3LB55_9BACT|nr:response regulator [Puniceicoccus sp. CR14]WOO42854.1 response regulator [Puniceicoccus sp. CR14]
MGLPGNALVVEDEDHVRLFVKLMLQQLGVAQIFEASNGKEALEVYENVKPDVVLLDVNMPVMDGLETLDKIHKMDPDAVVIILTSLATRETVESSAAKGAVQFIRKDVPREAMSNLLVKTFDECFE